MKLRLAIITRSRAGQPVRNERIIDAHDVTFGRAAGSTVHLADPRVPLDAATLVRTGDGDWFTSLVTDAPQRVRVKPGRQVEIGPYTVRFEATPDGVDVALAVELTRPLPEELGALRRRPIALTQTWLPKRSVSWLLFVVVVGALLAWPLQQAYQPALRKASAEQGWTPDLAWNPGELAAPHHLLNRRCDACHQQPFVQVRDVACGDCHRDTDGHARDAALQANLFGASRCASCHTDHKGALALAHPSSASCVDCHRQIGERSPTSKLGAAADFAHDHPEFLVTIWRGPGREARDYVRIAHKDRTLFVERSGLKFPHDVHLRPGLQGPEGKEKLGCVDCHQLQSGGRLFAPVSMQQQCQRCHSLEFEPLASTRQAPHGDVREVVASIHEFYRSAALAVLPLDAPPASPLNRTIGDGALDPAARARGERWAQRKAQEVARDLIEVRACVVCHEVRREPKAGWAVEPVQLTQRWLPGSRFDHARHAMTPCADCHKVEHSKRAEDVAMPDLATCRTCHAGNEPQPNKVTSACLMCHGFHLPERAPMLVDGRKAEGGAIRPVRREAP